MGKGAKKVGNMLLGGIKGALAKDPNAIEKPKEMSLPTVPPPPIPSSTPLPIAPHLNSSQLIP